MGLACGLGLGLGLLFTKAKKSSSLVALRNGEEGVGLGKIGAVHHGLPAWSVKAHKHQRSKENVCAAAACFSTVVHMGSPYFEGAESISGLGLFQFLGYGPGIGAETWGHSPNLGQNLARQCQRSQNCFQCSDKNFCTPNLGH